MKKLTEVKKARAKVPATEAKKSFNWGKKGEVAAEIALLLLWTLIAVIASQFVVARIIEWIIGIIGESVTLSSGALVVVNALYSLFSYILALWLIIWVAPRVARNWSFRIETKNHKIAKKGSDKKVKTNREEMGLKGLLTWTDIGLAPVAYVVATLLAAGLTALFTVFPWFDAEQVQETGFGIWMNGGERVIAFLVLVVLAPIVEELIFRGWLYGKLRRELNAPVAILLTSLLFALIHFQWNVSVNVFTLSVVLCVLREITGTVYSGILTHMLKNGIAFYLLYVIGV